MSDDGDRPLRKISAAFKDLAAVIINSDEDVKVDTFSAACSLVSPLFGCLGIAFKFAEMDYVAKVGDLVEASKSIATLQDLIDQDIARKCVTKAGSHSRNLLKVKRGLDMIRVLFEGMLVTEGNCLKEPATTAYAKVFAPYNGWAIRKAVGAGMYALPTKEHLLEKLNEEEDSARIMMQNYVVSSASVIAFVDELFHSRELGVDW